MWSSSVLWYNRAMIEKVFRDPVHNYIHVDHQVIYDLINTKEFQRLRRIKQLGTSGYTFHGGEPTKFLDASQRFLTKNIQKFGIVMKVS